jgi:branched-subunit amino acid transport protein
MSAYLLFAVIGAGTWLLRVCFVALVPADRLPSWFRDSLDLLAPAVLAAVVALDLTGGIRHATSGAEVGFLLGGAGLLGLVGWRRRNALLIAALALGLVLVADLVVWHR